MKILDELKSRGIFKAITSEEKFNKLIKGDKVYIGFDPTAKSLHLGNYIQIAILRRFKKAGFIPIAVLGGATGMIGDPSGKSEERNLLSKDDLNVNKAAIRKQLESFGFEVIDNYDFYKDINILEFLRNAGKLLSINYMLAKDSVSSRLETGMSFTEFSYQLIQGWDFKELFEKHDVKVQIGGSDQWGNITSGLEMIRKSLGDSLNAIGITTNLLMSASGKKFGKSEGNAIWLDQNMTSSFELYQYLLSTNDSDVKQLLFWLTDETEETINNQEARQAQKLLAFDVVRDIHGIDQAKQALVTTDILYGSKSENTLTTNQALSLERSIPTFNNILGNIVDVLIDTKLVSSKREARELVNKSSIKINGEIAKIDSVVTKELFDKKANIIRCGKKKIILIKY